MFYTLVCGQSILVPTLLKQNVVGKRILMIMPTYRRGHPSASAFSPLLFGACPPVPSCTGTPASVSPLDAATQTLHQITTKAALLT